ncbi:HD domain-containing protein [Lentibacillus lipolyticus]|nr:HD domain-containing protein [Lentibacillus lipolyticus]
MENNQKRAAIRDYVRKIFQSDNTGHDFFHMQRVARTAKEIAACEKADLFICEAGAWIHDIGDEKLFSDRKKAIWDVKDFLYSIQCTEEQVDRILEAAADVSFRKGKTPESLEGKVVQDADRLDAIGAIGIARTFAYGASNDQLIWHDDDGEQKNTSIQHFYDKLLNLKEMMNTDSAKQIATERHQFMETYLRQFMLEWGSTQENEQDV